MVEPQPYESHGLILSRLVLHGQQVHGHDRSTHEQGTAYTNHDQPLVTMMNYY